MRSGERQSPRPAEPVIEPCRVVAALDSNHRGDLTAARALVDAAIECGADGVKLQRREVASAAVRSVLDQPLHRHHPHFGSTWREVLERVQLTEGVFAELVEYARARGTVVAAPHDLASLVFLDRLPIDVLQIDAPVAVHLSLLCEVARRGKPVIVDVGLCTDQEMSDVLRVLQPCQVTLMYSIRGSASEIALGDLYFLSALAAHGQRTGYSDELPGISAALMARAFGVSEIQKRIASNGDVGAPEGAGSIAAEALRSLVHAVRHAEEVMAGTVERLPPAASFDDFDVLRPSIVAAVDLPRGTVLNAEMLTMKAPARGLSPKYLHRLVGKRLLYDVDADEFVTFGLIEP